MNLLGLLLGANAVKSLTNYPSEIRELRRQMPKSEREALVRDYKQLSSDAKNQFKDYLRKADMQGAGSVIGRDLSSYKIRKKEENNEPAAASQLQEESGTDIIDRVNRILAVPTDVDPVLVAEAARKYEEAVPSKSGNIIEKTQKIVDMSR